MKMLRITGCSRPGMWYADKVGQLVPYVGWWEEERCYKSREPAGYINRVEFADAQLVDLPAAGSGLAEVVLWLPEIELRRLAEYGGYVRVLSKPQPGFVPMQVVADHG